MITRDNKSHPRMFSVNDPIFVAALPTRGWVTDIVRKVLGTRTYEI